VANNRLLGALVDGTWDGRDLDAELARLDTEDGVRYVFCPEDARFSVRADGMLEPVEGEVEVALPPETRAELEGLGSALLERWRAAGNQPWILRQITEALGALGWSEAGKRGSQPLVRAWLREWPQVARVGQDYWVIAGQVPEGPRRTRLQVVRIAAAPADEPSLTGSVATGAGDTASGLPGVLSAPSENAELVPAGEQPVCLIATWTAVLRTIHLVEGFLRVPATARGAYPPRAPSLGKWEVLHAKWFDTNEDLWVWLDREGDLLCGTDLAEKLGWCDAGERLQVQWAPDRLVLRSLGIDAEVQREEARLVDAEALAALRGGLGETYRRSLLTILGEVNEGLSFPEVVAALRARQGHNVHRGTVRALLHAGGFSVRKGRWFAALDAEAGARRLRGAMVEALLPISETEALTASSDGVANPMRLRDTARAVQARLRELVGGLGSSSKDKNQP
jgi:hypothetical protein